jgi:hypothetical protein
MSGHGPEDLARGPDADALEKVIGPERFDSTHEKDAPSTLQSSTNTSVV